MKTSIVLGFLFGAVVGFAWSQGTKSSLANNVQTDYKDGKIIVTADITKAAVEGVYSIFQ